MFDAHDLPFSPLINCALYLLQIVMSVVVLSDGRIVSGSQDKTLRIWDLATGACDMVLEGHEGVSHIMHDMYLFTFTCILPHK